MKGKLGVILLAAGKGTRLNEGRPSQKPKVLFELAGKPMIAYSVANFLALNPAQMVVVVGFKAAMVKAFLGPAFTYAFQREQLGTAHAVQCGLKKIKPEITTVLIANGDDSAFYTLPTLRKFIAYHQKAGNVLTFLTVQLTNPFGLGRVVRDNRGRVLQIVEEKEANSAQKRINEVNVGCYLAEVSWLKESLKKVAKSPSGEYYLVDVVEIGVKEDHPVGTFLLPNRGEWQGVNTPEELALADKMMRRRLR